jgi:hypothetical protein
MIKRKKTTGPKAILKRDRIIILEGPSMNLSFRNLDPVME